MFLIFVIFETYDGQKLMLKNISSSFKSIYQE